MDRNPCRRPYRSDAPMQSSPPTESAALLDILKRKKKKGKKKRKKGKKSAKTFPCRLTFKSIARIGALNLTLDLLIQEVYSVRRKNNPIALPLANELFLPTNSAHKQRTRVRRSIMCPLD